jgi:hypothetical protein
MKLFALPHIVSVAALFANTASAGLFGVTIDLDFAGFNVVSSAGTVEILTPTSAFRTSSSFSLNVQPGVNSGTDLPEQAGTTTYSFIIQPDAQHQIGDLVNATVNFAASGSVTTSGNEPVSVNAEGDMYMLLTANSGPIPITSTYILTTYLGLLDDNPNFRDYLTFDFSSIDSGFAYGYQYDLSVHEVTYGNILHHAEADNVPDSLGRVTPAVTMIGLGIVSYLQSRKRKIVRFFGLG